MVAFMMYDNISAEIARLNTSKDWIDNKRHGLVYDNNDAHNPKMLIIRSNPFLNRAFGFNHRTPYTPLRGRAVHRDSYVIIRLCAKNALYHRHLLWVLKP